MGNEVSAPSTTTPAVPTVAGSGPALDGAADDSGHEDVEILVTRLDCFVYTIRPRPSAEGYVADSWGLGEPAGLAYCHVTAHDGGAQVQVALWQREEQTAGSKSLKARRPASAPPAPYAGARAPLGWGHALLAKAGVAVGEGRVQAGFEPVRDSSRYFVLTVRSSDGRSAPLGIGFESRDAAFQLKSALYDHAARVDRQARGAAAAAAAAAAQGEEGGAVGGEGWEAQPAPPSPGPSPFALAQGSTLSLTLAGAGGHRGAAPGGGGGGVATQASRPLLLRPPPPPPPPAAASGSTSSSLAAASGSTSSSLAAGGSTSSSLAAASGSTSSSLAAGGSTSSSLAAGGSTSSSLAAGGSTSSSLAAAPTAVATGGGGEGEEEGEGEGFGDFEQA